MESFSLTIRSPQPRSNRDQAATNELGFPPQVKRGVVLVREHAPRPPTGIGNLRNLCGASHPPGTRRARFFAIGLRSTSGIDGPTTSSPLTFLMPDPCRGSGTHCVASSRRQPPTVRPEVRNIATLGLHRLASEMLNRLRIVARRRRSVVAGVSHGVLGIVNGFHSQYPMHDQK